MLQTGCRLTAFIMAVYNLIMLTSVKYMVPVFDHHLPVKMVKGYVHSYPKVEHVTNTKYNPCF
jgi:hypothetical protein